MPIRASQETLSALLLLAKHGQAYATREGGWKLQGTEERIPDLRMNGMVILGYVRALTTAVRIKATGKEQIIQAVDDGRLPSSVRKLVASEKTRRSVTYRNA